MKFSQVFLIFLLIFFNISNCAENIYYEPGQEIYVKNSSEKNIVIRFQNDKSEIFISAYAILKPNEEIPIELCQLKIYEKIDRLAAYYWYNDKLLLVDSCPFVIGKTYEFRMSQNHGNKYHFNMIE